MKISNIGKNISALMIGGLVSSFVVSIMIAEPARAELWTPAFNQGPQKTLVLVIGYPACPLPAESEWPAVMSSVTQDIFGATAPSLADFIYENSYHQTSLYGDVYGPYWISDGSSDFYQNISKAMEQLHAQNHDLDLTSYQRVIQAFNCNSGTGPSPYNTDLTKVTPSGPAQQTWASAGWNSKYLLFHEFAHTLGISHSDFLSCSDYPGDSLLNCKHFDGFNMFTVMSPAWKLLEFTAIQRRQAGWLDPNNELESISATSGSFTLAPIESSSGLREIRVPYGIIQNFNGNDPDTRYRYGDVQAEYSIIYRKPSGSYDSISMCGTSTYSPYCSYNNEYAVFVSLSTKSIDSARPWLVDHVLDETPGSIAGVGFSQFDAMDGSIRYGEGFHDNNIHQSINYLYSTINGVQIELVDDPADCTRRMPDVSAATRTIPPGTSVKYQFTVTNMDDVA